MSHNNYQHRGGEGGGGGHWNHHNDRRGSGGSGGRMGGGGGGGNPRRGGGNHHHRGGGGGGGGPPLSRRRKNPNFPLVFHSFQEERDWVLERRRQRQSRKTKFDQFASSALMHPNLEQQQQQHANDNNNMPAVDWNNPQHTRHARRLYVGNLPESAAQVVVTEDTIHQLFQNAIQTCSDVPLSKDPILSVFLHAQHRYCFVELDNADICTASLELDGLPFSNTTSRLSVKRPNEYNPLLAPPTTLEFSMDVSKVGLCGKIVRDGPNKLFVGNLPFHLSRAQVLELLSAFGRVRALALIMNTATNTLQNSSSHTSNPEPQLSKGYCFVEYSDPAVTPVALEGLNKMELGGNNNSDNADAEKQQTTLIARLAAQADLALETTTANHSNFAVPPPPNRTIVTGYDIEALVDAAMGLIPMPQFPTYFDALQQPLTRIVSLVPTATTANASVSAPPSGHGNGPSPPPLQQQQQQQSPQQSVSAAPTRILVLLNMVTADDLATTDNYTSLVQEVREECSKFGSLTTVEIPRVIVGSDNTAQQQQSAIGKVFLEYATVADAQEAQRELQGRQFGTNTVEAIFYPENDFGARRLR